MSITNQLWLSQSLLPKDNAITLGSTQYPIAIVTCNRLNADELMVTNQTTINNTDIKDPLVTLAHGNTSDVVNTGILHSYVSSGQKYGGLLRYAGNSKYYLTRDASTLPTVSTDISTLSRADLFTGELTATKNTLTNTTNQLVLGTTNTTTISSTAPSSSRTYTIPDAGGPANFILSTAPSSQSITNNLFVYGTLSSSSGDGKTYTSLSTSLLTQSDATTNNLINTESKSLVFRTADSATPETQTTMLSLASTQNRSHLPLWISTTSLQLKMGANGNSTTINCPIASADRTYVVPDVKVDADFLLTQGDQTIPGKKTFSGGAPILGITDGSNAAAGYVGEYIESVVRVANTGASSLYADYTSITLTAGDWDIFVTANFYQINAGTTAFLVGVSSTAGNSASGLQLGNNVMQESTAGVGFQSSATIHWRRNITSSTTYYAKYNDGGLQYDTTAKICARRVR